MVSRTAFGYIVSTFVFFFLGLYPITAAFAQQGRFDGWGMGPGMMGGWGMGWFGGIFMVVFWITILVGLVLVIKWLAQAAGKKKDRPKWIPGDGYSQRALCPGRN